MRPLLLAGLAAGLALQAQAAPQGFTLPNGLRVVHLEDHTHPVVRIRLHVKVEPGDVPLGRQGLPLLTEQMIRHSDAADLKAEAFDRLLGDAGIRLVSRSTPDMLEWRLAARSRDQDRALNLLADRLLRAVFDPMVLEAQRLACWQGLQQSDAPPHQQLEAALLEGPGTRPTLATLGAITLDDLLSFRARVLHPERALLLIHGDMGLEQVKRLVLLSLGPWTRQQIPAPAPPGLAAGLPAAGPDPLRIAMPSAGLRIQALLPPPEGLSPEAAALLSRLLPGDPALFPASLAWRPEGLLATLDAGPETSEGAAWTLLMDRLDRIRRRGLTAQDLDRARTAWTAARSLDALDPEAQLDRALAQGTGRAETTERMRALSLGTLNAALRAWLEPSRSRRGVAAAPSRTTP